MTPEDYAQQVLNEYDIKDIPAISFQKIFDACNIICDEQKYNDLKYSGSLHRFLNQSIILVNADFDNVGRKNFTKAHELGHFFLKHSGDKFECTIQDMYTNDKRRKPQEIEANQFAGAFLLPLKKMKLLIHDDNYDFTTIRAIATNYVVSLSVVVIRTIPLLKDAWCGIWAENGIIKWSARSSACGQLIIKNGNRVRTGSVSYRCFANKFNPQENYYEEVPCSTWLVVNNSEKTVREMTVFLRKYNATLSLLKF